MSVACAKTCQTSVALGRKQPVANNSRVTHQLTCRHVGRAQHLHSRTSTSTCTTRLRASPDARNGQQQEVSSSPTRVEDSNAKRRMTGLWKKLPGRCDPVDSMFQMFEVSWILQQAVKILNYIEIDDTERHFSVAVKAGILDITETYPWSGEMRDYRRRDLRFGGKLQGKVERSADGPVVTATWEEPIAGQMQDVFSWCPQTGCLIQTTTCRRFSTMETHTYRTVYQKSD